MADPAAAPGRSIFWWVVGPLLVLLLVPFLATEIPPVVDYPNHLARAYFLARGQADPVLSRMLAAHWTILPNLASDLLLVPLLGVLPVYLAGRIVLAAAMLAPLLGGMAYSRALFGRTCHWALASTLIAFNFAFLLGLMNFLFGIGAAFVVAAIWLRWRETCPRRAVLAATLGAVVVFFCHISALALVGVLIAAYEAARLAEPAGRRHLFRRATAVLCVFAPVVLLYSLSLVAGEGGPLRWFPPGSKLLLAATPFVTRDYIDGIILLVVLIGFMIIAIERRWLLVPRSTIIAAAVLLLLYIVAPDTYKGGALVDLRLLTMLAYLLFAGVAEPATLSRRGLLWAAVLVVVVVGGRTGALAQVWSQQSAIVAEMRQTIAPIVPGSRVLVTVVTAQDAPAYWRDVAPVQFIEGGVETEKHLPALVLLERHSLWPLVFASPSQQPMVVRRAYRASVAPRSLALVPDYMLLREGHLTRADQDAYPYLVQWRAKFDYVLVMQAGGMPDPAKFLPNQLTLLQATPIAALFQVQPMALATP